MPSMLDCYHYCISMTISFPQILGTHNTVRLPTGKKQRVIMLNNAATTPPFEQTLYRVNEFLQTYGALHRGAGPHAATTYQKVEQAIAIIRRFLGVRHDQGLLFTQNTSTAISLFARLLRLQSQDVVLTSTIEHTSNNLPWSHTAGARVVYVNAFDDGSLDYDDLEKKVHEHAQHLKLIAITGASNLTGYIPNIPRIAKLAHDNGALLFVDAAQLAPHRPINMHGDGIDALAFSAHKAYAPFGLGVLVLPKKLMDAEPVDPGGGSIDMLTEHHVAWASAEVRHQTGTWNVTGIIATAESCRILMETGWDKLIQHEQELVRYTAQQLSTVSRLKLYVPKEKYLTGDRIGTFPFNLQGYHHALLSAVLENEYGIETRAGTICNHRLVRRWANVSDVKQAEIEQEIAKGNRLASYGIVRASLGIHNTKEDIDVFVHALQHIAQYEPALEYQSVPAEEIYTRKARS